MSVRRAQHAGTWYPSDPSELRSLFDEMFGRATSTSLPVKAIISPHAGYKYSGTTAAWAFKSLNPGKVKRVFVLGPCHHTFVDGCALPCGVSSYATPLGDLPVDTELIQDLKSSSSEIMFRSFKQCDDEEEHSIEMQLPILRYVLGPSAKIVPIYIGSLGQSEERVFGRVLSRYFDDPSVLFVISSDFCHWGNRFRFTPSAFVGARVPLVYPLGSVNGQIESLDRQGMELIVAQDSQGFFKYCESTGNTICGRNPILILLEILREAKTKCNVDFVHYSQSGLLPDIPTRTDSCVSYAAALCVGVE